MKKIDMHVHSRHGKSITWPNDQYTYINPHELRKYYSDLNIEKGVLLPGVSPEGRHYSVNNEEAMKMVEENPDLYYWFCGIDPRWGSNSPQMDLSWFISYYKDKGAKGVGEVTAKLPFDDPKMQNLFFHCQKCKMPMLFHVGTKNSFYGIVDQLGLPGLEKALDTFPDLLFIGHSQPFWAEIGSDVTHENRNGYPTGRVKPGGRVVELLRKYNNLTCDLSAGSGYNAVTRDPEFGYDFLEEFQDKLYYGTDIAAPKEYEFLKLGQWLDEAQSKGKISRKAYEKIIRLNALKVLEGSGS